MEALASVKAYHTGGQKLQTYHKGVLLSWSNKAAVAKEPNCKPLPHRAFDLKGVIQYNKEILMDYLDNHINGNNTFPKWDKAKRLMRNHAIKA